MKLLFYVIIFILSTNINAQINKDDTFNEAIKKIDNKDYIEAINLLKLLDNNENHLVYYYMGYCYYTLENDELAQLFFKRSIELNNTHIESHGYLGMSYFFTNQLDLSEEVFLRCIELRNEYFKDYYFLGKINEMKNNLNNSIKYYKEALRLNEHDFQTNYSLANVYFNNDDYIAARKYFEICDSINNEVYPVISCLIRIRYRQNDLDMIEDLKKRLRLVRKSSDDERLISLQRFTIDTFRHGDLNIFVEESFDLSGALYYHWIFRICDNEGKFIKSVNLESSSVLRELGTNYIVGMDRFENNRRIHQTTNIGFKELPEYSIMKNIVIREIEIGLGIITTGVY